jgi:tetratricopeptide (TPR) repeat protein
LKLLIEEERNGGDVKKLLYAAYHNRGLAQRSAKRLSSAINDFERALTYLSENEMAERGIETLYQLARANHEHRDYVQAMECYKRVVHINPAYSMASYYLGNLLFDNAHYKEAISSFSKAIAKDPKDHISLFNRGMCYDYLDKNKESVEDFERVINLAPDYSKAYAELAKALYKRDGDDVDARRMLDLFETAADKSLTDEQITKQEAARIFFDRGVLLNKTDILGEAVASFTEALRLDDQLLDAYFNRGIIYRELNNLEEALQDFEHVLRLDQNDIGALSERGLIYLRTNHLQKALDDFMRMAEIDPNNPNALQLIEYTREEMEKEQL